MGGGPTALFVFKRLVETGRSDLRVEVFERRDRLGHGMPYGHAGAGLEHITNVSGNELPDLPTPLVDWIAREPEEEIEAFGLDPVRFNEDRILPRLLFGRYLEAQFQALIDQAPFKTEIHLDTPVDDVVPLPDGRLRIKSALFEAVFICTGHRWPERHEGKTEGVFDSPYPPSKLSRRFPAPVAIRGSSLTAVDAIRTLARSHGSFVQGERLRYEGNGLKIVMHSRSGLLPCVRIHLEDPQLSGEELLSDNVASLDEVFDKSFKRRLAEKDPQMFERIKDLTLEQFVETALDPREQADPFELLAAEYAEAQERKTVHWKEALAILSFAANYPAKHFSAEDTLRLQRVLAPLIGIVIAFLPRSSCAELLALHEAGCLDLIAVGDDADVEVDPAGGVVFHYTDADGKARATRYPAYVDCIGQPHLPISAFPFPSLRKHGLVHQARVAFRCAENALREGGDNVEQDADGSYHLLVSGIAINDSYQPIGADGKPTHPGLFVLAVPYIGGHNPDYSGLDFCEEASQRAVGALQYSSPKEFSTHSSTPSAGSAPP